MKRRLTEDFVGYFDRLTSCTGNSPNNVRAALRRDGQLTVVIGVLHEIWRTFDDHRRFGKRRFIAQAHHKFRRSFKQYGTRWKDPATAAMKEWEAEKGENPDRDVDGFGLLWDGSISSSDKVNVPSHEAPESVGRTHQIWTDEDFDREFDPDKHSAKEAIDLATTILEQETNWDADGPHAAACLRALGAFNWLRETLDLDVDKIATRWKKIPVIVVPAAVSDKHGIEDPLSLFGYLAQIRLAYMIGADLAAIAMCRAVTEILIRVHYNNQDYGASLMTLIEKTQKTREGKVLFEHKIRLKVQVANAILHVSKEGKNQRDWSSDLVPEWVSGLQDMIEGLRQQA